MRTHFPLRRRRFAPKISHLPCSYLYTIDALYVIGVLSPHGLRRVADLHCRRIGAAQRRRVRGPAADLAQRPDAGALITQTGGLRKVRWRVEGGGKPGGVRVIYYHVAAQVQIRMILIYRKGIKDDLTPREKAVLRKMNAEW